MGTLREEKIKSAGRLGRIHVECCFWAGLLKIGRGFIQVVGSRDGISNLGNNGTIVNDDRI